MIYVVTYDELALIKKIKFRNGMMVDILPSVQEILYAYRQNKGASTEAGGILIGYENIDTGNFTVASATDPQVSDVRTYTSLRLGIHHHKLLKKIEQPYGYIGTWHTHPASVPSPSSVDLKDWEKSIKHNGNATKALVFIISGTMGYRIWLYESDTYALYEGDIL